MTEKRGRKMHVVRTSTVFSTGRLLETTYMLADTELYVLRITIMVTRVQSNRTIEH